LRFFHPFLAILAAFLPTAASQATEPPTYKESGGVLILEAEETVSELGEWTAADAIPGFTGKGYLEFTGNSPVNGPPNSPITYRFRISKPGLYRLHLRCAREKIGDRHDLANDAYVRVEGDFEPGPAPGDVHGMDAPREMLGKDTKFFGGKDREFAWASGNRLDPGGHENKRVAIYRFKKGETYGLVVSGRSQKFKLDRILFRHIDVPKESAEDLALPASFPERD